MTSRMFLVIALISPFATACIDAGSDDELDVDDAAEGDAAKADNPGGTYTYYYVERDTNQCSPPACRGYFYKLANASSTKCHDGTQGEFCYAAMADWDQLGLAQDLMDQVTAASNSGQVLVRASVVPRTWPGNTTWAQLNPTEAWLPQVDGATNGPLVKIDDSGIRCAVSPCPTFVERKLNSGMQAKLAALRWTNTGATEEQIVTALDKMKRGELIISGQRFSVSGPGNHKGRRVSQYWLRATNAPGTCFVGGCSGEICSDHPNVGGRCGWEPEFACYQSATCEAQADGSCGWTQSPELQACLANPPS